MSEQPNTLAPQQVDLDVLGVLKRMQQQLVYLEKKIDTLIKQSSERPSFNKDRHFSRPFRPGGFSRSFHRGKGDHDAGHGAKSPSQERPFGKPGGENREFGRGRKAFFRRQKSHGPK